MDASGFRVVAVTAEREAEVSRQHAARISDLKEQLQRLRAKLRAERKEAGVAEVAWQEKVEAAEASVVDRASACVTRTARCVRSASASPPSATLLRRRWRRRRRWPSSCPLLWTVWATPPRPSCWRRSTSSRVRSRRSPSGARSTRESSRTSTWRCALNPWHCPTLCPSPLPHLLPTALTANPTQAQRVKAAYQQRDEARAALGEYYTTGTGESVFDAADRVAKLDRQLAEQQARIEQLQAEIKGQTVDAAKLRAIAGPPKSKFYEAGHFSAAVDQVIIELLSCGVARNKLPQLFLIFARFYGILIPGRMKKVPGPCQRTTVERYVYYLPGKSHVKEMAAVMNQLNKLQVGEWLLEHIESDETSCCYLADRAACRRSR